MFRAIKRAVIIFCLVFVAIGAVSALVTGSYDMLYAAAVFIGIPFACLYLIPWMIAGSGEELPTHEERRLARAIADETVKRMRR